MKKLTAITGTLLVILFSAPLHAVVQKDTTGCKDHPLFTKMPDYWIRSCDQKQFDSYGFLTAKGQKTQVEGQLWKYSYYPQADLKSKPSELQIQRNFENAIEKQGGTVVFKDRTKETFKLVKDGMEIWIELATEFTGKYGFVIVQKQGMVQERPVQEDHLMACLFQDCGNRERAQRLPVIDLGVCRL